MWSPSLYSKFSTERFAPFDDLVRLIDIKDHLRVVDLGCGSGDLTIRLSEMLPESNVLGIDNSPEMLERANGVPNISRSVHFELLSIENFVAVTPAGSLDLVFSNAAIHWVADHSKLLEELWRCLAPGGQLVVQVPSGVRNRAQRAVNDVALEEPFYSALEGWQWKFPVLPVDNYVELLYTLGANEIVVFEKVYPHVLKDASAVFDWISGTTMNGYLPRLEASGLVEDFKAKILVRISELYPGSPTIYPFRRIFFRGTKPN